MSVPPGVDLSHVPALTPPPGVKPNFNNPESRAHATIIANGITTGVMLAFVVTRVYTKLAITKSFAWEDYACIIGAILATGYLGVIVHIFNTGLGAHQWDIPVTVLLNETTVKYLKASNFLYGPTMVFAKLSILLLYFQLFFVNRKVRALIYFAIAVTILIHFVGTIIAITLCLPSNPILYAKCAGKLNPLDWTISAINVLSDFYILCIPLLVISQLQMAFRKKLGIITVFLTGFLACMSSIVGLIYRVLLYRGHDTSWWLGPLLTFSLLEVNVGLIVGCMPILPALLRKLNLTAISPSIFRSIRKSTTKDSKATLVQESGGHSHIDGFKASLGQKSMETTISGVTGSYTQLEEIRRSDDRV